MGNSFGIIILAAGNSSRLGEPKQLLKYRNKSLIENVVDAAIRTGDTSIIVVTGSNNSLIEGELKNKPVHFAYNANWETGMSSSIRCGLEALLSLNADSEGVILAVSDQPFVNTDLFNDIIQKAKSSGSEIVACEYDGASGTPVFFAKRYFEALLHLSGQEGAKKLLKKYEKDVATVPFSLGDIDIDTKEDFKKLQHIQ